MSYCVFIQCFIIHVAMSFCLCHYRGGHLKIVEYLTSIAADVNAKDSAGETPLHDACR